MTDRWLLLETFSGAGREPSVIAKGRAPAGMVPLRTVMGKNRYLDEARALVARAASTSRPVRMASADGQRQLAGDPLADFSGHVNGVYLWIGAPGERPPGRDPAGAWYFNLTTGRIGGSDDLLDLYGVAPEDRKAERLTAEAFTRLMPHADEAAALALIVRAQPGDEHQATWVARRDDGDLRAVRLVCRTVEHRLAGGRAEAVTRGITQDIGPAGSTSSAPRGPLLERLVIEAEQQPGRARAVVNPRTLALLRWIDAPLPGLAWTGSGPYPPQIHPGDAGEVRRMRAGFARSGSASGTLRLMADDGGWMRVGVTAGEMRLDKDATAALVTLDVLPAPEPGGGG